ncbi:MAG: hypothetical protein U9P80_02385 [Thermodesulfobacteriota bacterium]|nr:hypothetical protein [Thermodesulfobacteriota bacterium]
MCWSRITGPAKEIVTVHGYFKPFTATGDQKGVFTQRRLSACSAQAGKDRKKQEK